MKDFKNFGIKIRENSSENYKAVWTNLKTIRLGEGKCGVLPIDEKEFYDVAINTKCNAECSFCLPPEAKIETSVGQIPIISIKEGDFVYSFNEKTGDTELKRVDQLFIREYEDELIEIETDNGVLRLTPNHKVYTKNRGWVEASNLQLSDTLLNF